MVPAKELVLALKYIVSELVAVPVVFQVEFAAVLNSPEFASTLTVTLITPERLNPVPFAVVPGALVLKVA